jgi:hypothetical protein
MSCDYGIADQRSYEQNIGVALLVFQRHQAHLRAATGPNINAAVADSAQFATASLIRVRLIEVETAQQEISIFANIHGVAVEVVLARSFGPPRYVVVFSPVASARAVRIVLEQQSIAFLSWALGDGDTNVRIRQSAGWTRRAYRGNWHRVLACLLRGRQGQLPRAERADSGRE